MTPKEQTELVYEQRQRGAENGETIARIVIKKFPNGFSGKDGIQIQQITDQALAHVIHKLTMNNIDTKYRDAFAEGFRFGVSSTLSKNASGFAARALRTK